MRLSVHKQYTSSTQAVHKGHHTGSQNLTVLLQLQNNWTDVWCVKGTFVVIFSLQIIWRSNVCGFSVFAVNNLPFETVTSQTFRLSCYLKEKLRVKSLENWRSVNVCNGFQALKLKLAWSEMAAITAVLQEVEPSTNNGLPLTIITIYLTFYAISTPFQLSWTV